VLSRTGEQPVHPHFDPTSTDDGEHKIVAFARAKRHSRHVSILKTALPVAAVAIGLAFVAYSYAVTPAKVSVNVSESAISNGKLVMASPKLEGFTKENRPYSMTAIRAYQDLKNPHLIELEDILAKLPYDESNFASIEAAGGFYDQKGNTLEMKSGLTVKTTDGMSVDLKSAYIDIAKGDLKTRDPVDIKLNGTSIQADSMSIEDQGKVMVFDKRVRMVVEPQRMNALRKADGS
jgi:lipopolysaccharide export system protein LptC